jgi:hypothetical protein
MRSARLLAAVLLLVLLLANHSVQLGALSCLCILKASPCISRLCGDLQKLTEARSELSSLQSRLAELQAVHNEERDALKSELSECSKAAVAAIANSVAALFSKSTRQRTAVLSIQIFKNWHTVAHSMASKRCALAARAVGRDADGATNMSMMLRGWYVE